MEAHLGLEQPIPYSAVCDTKELPYMTILV